MKNGKEMRAALLVVRQERRVARTAARVVDRSAVLTAAVEAVSKTSVTASVAAAANAATRPGVVNEAFSC